MNELREVLINLQSCRAEESDSQLDQMLDDRAFAIMDILIERHQECRQEMLAAIAKVRG